MFPGRFMSSPMYLADGYNFQQGDRRTTRQARRAASAAQRNQSLEPAQTTSTADGNAAPPGRSFVERIGLANPFRAGWMPPMRFPGRARREQNNAAHGATSPAPAQLEEVVVR
jgi:hypothetical protein